MNTESWSKKMGRPGGRENNNSPERRSHAYWSEDEAGAKETRKDDGREGNH